MNTMPTNEHEPLVIDTIDSVGEELTDDDLAMVAGGQRVIDIKSYDEDGRYVDHDIYFVD